jgi:hypothetical protein
MSRYLDIRPTVYGGRRPSELGFRPPRGRDLDLTAAGDGERLRRLFFR